MNGCENVKSHVQLKITPANGSCISTVCKHAVLRCRELTFATFLLHFPVTVLLRIVYPALMQRRRRTLHRMALTAPTRTDSVSRVDEDWFYDRRCRQSAVDDGKLNIARCA